ncbi:anthranilate synthase, component II [Desulfobulbus propionicus DSM 2032]|uniref:Anthranilate synthase, component II n=1 Tax=Desulfobulbus propionicus (strain ATCC 33891 / DSM 2032 / VKM B-1956 / 1pr3) TaxID=577650 RepID=A0A7U3YLH4_DESPD|nr:aminodeoxychorismate/anthranilate synthase component II [Desulfobulbus propionicus]ADW17569.1 anthranilate synthase, component II [Desulfobulbus propionicus DSM 2032]
MIVIIDNYDSFTYNIVQTLATAPPSAPAGWQAPDIRVFRNDAITLAEIEALQPDRLLISPGPCTPTEAGISMAAIRHFSGRIPVLGVCLGHQSIGEAFGGKVIRATRLMHGKTSPVHHDNRGVFTGLPLPFDGMRYHSLVVEEPLPDCLEATAYTDQGELMGLRHKTLPIEGVQFHPESIMTGPGNILLHNFLRPEYAQLLRRRQ